MYQGKFCRQIGCLLPLREKLATSTTDAVKKQSLFRSKLSLGCLNFDTHSSGHLSVAPARQGIQASQSG
jgi:hypothetical protein